MGNRFYATAIDKCDIVFDGKSYKELFEDMTDVLSSKLFQSRTLDQELAIVYKIYCGLQSNGGIGDFDRIFTNPRILASGITLSQCKLLCENLKKSAISLIQHYNEIYGSNCLSLFVKREQIRVCIAEKIIKQLFLPPEFLSVIVEDLSAPYYRNIFANKKIISELDLNNLPLIDALVNDLIIECCIVADEKSSIPTLTSKTKSDTDCLSIFRQRTTGIFMHVSAKIHTGPAFSSGCRLG